MKEDLVERIARLFWAAANPDHAHLWDEDGSWPSSLDRDLSRDRARACLSEIEAAGLVIVPRNELLRIAADLLGDTKQG